MIYVYEEGTIVLHLNDANRDYVIENAVAITEADLEIVKNSLEPKQDHSIELRAKKSEGVVYAVYVKNRRTEADIIAETEDAIYLELFKEGRI